MWVQALTVEKAREMSQSNEEVNLLRLFIRNPNDKKMSNCTYCRKEYKDRTGSRVKYRHLVSCPQAPSTVSRKASEKIAENKLNRKIRKKAIEDQSMRAPIPTTPWHQLSREGQKFVHQSVLELILDGGFPFSLMQQPAMKRFFNCYVPGYHPQAPMSISEAV